MATFDLSRIDDFRYVANNALHLLHKEERQYLPFAHWYEAQEILWADIQKCLKAKRPVRKIVLKARQEGISTLTEAIFFHQLISIPNTKALILSQDDDSAKAIFDMSRNFYECLPAPIKPMKRYSTKRELVFENPDEKTRDVNPGLKSSIKIQTAGKFEPSRGAMFHCVHFSEVAFWPEDTASRLTSAIIPMVPFAPNTFIIYESTANGMNNDFYDDWSAAVDGESRFDPVFIPWFRLNTYSIQFKDEKKKKMFITDLDKEEKHLYKHFKVKPEQLLWRREKIAELRDEDTFRQEFPATPQEAFIFQNPTIFPREAMRHQQENVIEPIRVCDISIEQQTMIDNPEGLLNIFEEPEHKAEYIIGVDVASGEGADYSCCEVLKRTWPTGMADQVAEWHGKVDPVYFGRLIVILARYYNDAMLSIEINNHGFTTQTEAKNHYYNFYRWQYADRLGSHKMTDKLGWSTNVSTKPMLVDRAVYCLDANLVTVRSELLLQEMWQYVRIKGTMSYEAESGHDDTVMAWMIALTTLYMTQHGLDYDTMNVRALGPSPLAPDMPRQGDPMVIGKPALIDDRDPRGNDYGRDISFANL
jgi:hypothetical protein